MRPGGRDTQGVDGLFGDEDRVAGGLGQLFDAGSDVDGVADQSELQLSSAADRAGDHHTGVDPDADSKRVAESVRDEPMNQRGSAHGGVGMMREIIRGTEHRQRAVAEELVDMPAGLNHRRHNDFEQGVQASDGVLGAVRLGEWGEITDVDEHHRHLTALTGEDVVALLK